MSNKIIFNILHSNTQGGAEKMFLYYSEIMQKAGHELYCIVPKNFQYFDQLASLNIKTLIVNIKGHYDFIAAVKFHILVKQYRPNIIMAHNGRAFALVNFWRKLSKQDIKTIAVSHGGSLKRVLSFSAVITVAQYIKYNLKALNYKGKIFHIANFRKVASTVKPKKTSRKFTFGIIGRLNPEKNIALAITSFAQFLKTEKNAQLIIAGDGPEKDKLKAQAKNLSLEENITFLNWIDNIESFFNKIDLMILPSYEEPFGLVILEAFNYYTPVLSSNKGGPLEIIEENKNGFFFDSNDAKDLTKKMLTIYQNQKSLDKVSDNSYSSLTEKFSFAAGQKQLLAKLEEV